MSCSAHIDVIHEYNNQIALYRQQILNQSDELSKQKEEISKWKQKYSDELQKRLELAKIVEELENKENGCS